MFSIPCSFPFGILLVMTGVCALQPILERSLGSNLTLPIGWRENTSFSAPADPRQPSGNISTGTFQISCNGAKYRNNLKSESCLDALDQIPNDATNILFSMRTLSREYDVALPTRWISHDGLCVIEPILEDSVVQAVGSYAEIRNAGFALQAHCVHPRSEGGIATDLGVSKELGLVITSYDPRVECDSSPAPPLGSCKRIVDMMPASPRGKWFGFQNDRHGRPDVWLPRYLREISAQCYFLVQTTGPTCRSSWFEIWEAVQAIYGMCGRYGHMGKAVNRGVNGHLYVTMGDERLRNTPAADE